MSSLRKKAVSGLVWTFAERFGIQGIQFIISLVLARILMPEDFGLIGMITVFIAIGRALRDSGMTSSLIRTSNPTEKDYSTVFLMNFGASFAIYFLIFISAPWIADFYRREILSDLVRVQSLTILIGSFSSIQYARLTKAMNFKKQMSIQLPSMLLGGIVGLTMAYLDYGVWSLVYMSVVQSVALSTQYWFLTKWRPQFIFDKAKMKEHFSFGYKLTLSNLVNTIYNNILYLIIGRFFSAAQLGFYTRASGTKNLPLNNISSALDKVTYPLFSQIQDDLIKMKVYYRKIMQLVLFGIIPVLFAVAIIADPLFTVLFTEKWLQAASYFKILCFIGVLQPLNSYNINILTVKGRTDLFLKVQLINKSYTLLLILAMVPFGMYAILYMQIFISVVNYLVNSHYAGRLINYFVFEQLKDVAPIFLIGFLMYGSCFGIDLLIRKFFDHDLLRIFLVPAVGFLIYYLLAKLLNISSLRDIEALLKKSKKKPLKENAVLV